jgi:transposase
MQDSAPSHRARTIKALLRSMGAILITWPAYSPNLNPIENLWDVMKDWIQRNYPRYDRNLDNIRRIVSEAWDAISNERVRKLIETMPQRMQDVIDAQRVILTGKERYGGEREI